MRTMRERGRQGGFSIIELMVAVLLTLIITAAVVTLFTQSIRSSQEDDRYARMQENGRFAIAGIAEELSMAHFWGSLVSMASLTLVPNNLSAGEDCDLDLLSTAEPIRFNGNHAGATVETFDPADGTCPDKIGDLQPGTDLIAIKRVAGAETAAADREANRIYLRTNGTVGFLEKGSEAEVAGYKYWAFQPQIFYIASDVDPGPNEVPGLCRLTLDDSGAFPDFDADDCIAEGIEDLHMQFGIDTDADGVANQYKSDPTADELETLVSARIHLLVRSTETVINYTNDKAYVLGDLPASETSGGADNDGVFDDGYYRRVFTTTVLLRNPVNLAQLN